MKNTDFSNYFFITAIGVLAFLFYLIMKSFFVPILIAISIGILFNPAYNKLECKFHNKNLASFLMCALVFLIFIVPLSLLMAALVQQTASLYEDLDTGELFTCEDGIICERLNTLMENFDKKELVESVGKFLYVHGKNLIFGVTQTIFGFSIMLLTLFFVFRDGQNALEYVGSIMPLEKKYKTKILQKFRAVSNATLYGTLMIAIAQGIAGGIIFALFGIDAPIFWGFVMGFASLIPIVGTTLIWLPFGIYLLLTQSILIGILFIICGTFLIGGIDNFLRPFLLQRGTGMHTLLVFFSVLGALDVFGFIGIFVGPLIMAMFLTTLEIYRLKYG